VNLRLSLYGTQ